MLNHESFISELNSPNHYNLGTSPGLSIAPEDMLKKLLVQGRQIHEIQGNLTILISLYHAEKSHLSNVMRGMSLSRKYGLSGLIAHLRSLISVLSDLSELFASASARLYFAFDFFLTELHTPTKTYSTRFYDDFAVIEQSMAESIQSFSLIEHKLKHVYQSLHALQALKSTSYLSEETLLQTQSGESYSDSLTSVITELNYIRVSFQQNLTCINALQTKVNPN